MDCCSFRGGFWVALDFWCWLLHALINCVLLVACVLAMGFEMRLWVGFRDMLA